MMITQFREQIRSVEVKGLFNRFNHKVDLGSEGEKNIVILTAPNGHGKTVMLRIIDALFSKRLHYFWKLTFDEIVITFVSGKKIFLFRDEDMFSSDDDIEIKAPVAIKSKGFEVDNETHILSRSIPTNAIRHLDRYLPVDRVGPNDWFDYSKERMLTTDAVVELYADRLPEEIVDSFKIPDWLQGILSGVSTHLVETQRLLSINEDLESRQASRRRGTSLTSSVVDKDSRELATTIGQVLQDYANESQKLDQSFPHRVIESEGGDVDDSDTIRKRLESLNKKRDQLVTAGLIGETHNAPIELSDIFSDVTVRKILSIYINDTEQKLSVFDEIYGKIRLFKQILDGYFSFKSIEIDPIQGIRSLDQKNKSEIPLSELSSGEQHELVLIYELLFTVEDGALILIDEPELSLHVAWQKRFIPDLQKIQNLKNLQVIIATHSPQIINESWDLVQELTA